MRRWETNKSLFRQIEKGLLSKPLRYLSTAAAAVVGVVAATAATVIAAAAAISTITEEDYDEDDEPENAVVVTTVAKHDCSLSPHLRIFGSAQVCGRGQSISFVVAEALPPLLHRSCHNMRYFVGLLLFHFLGVKECPTISRKSMKYFAPMMR